jgi:hypothetical protein
METLIILIVLALLGSWVYNAGHASGKRVGSRKGYGVGFDRGRRSKGQNGCLVIIIAAGVTIAAATAALASLL